MAYNPQGQPVYFGLGNTPDPSKKRLWTSVDYVGWKPVVITPDMIGKTIGQIIAVETKTPDFKVPVKPRELKQAKFLDLVNQAGGQGIFYNGVGEPAIVP